MQRPVLVLLPSLIAAIALGCGGTPAPPPALDEPAPTASVSVVPAPPTDAGRLPTLRPLWENPDSQLAANLVANGDKLCFFRAAADGGTELVSIPIAGGELSIVAKGLEGNLMIANNSPVHDGAVYVAIEDVLIRVSLIDGKASRTPVKGLGWAPLAADASSLYAQVGDVLWRVGFDGTRSKLATLSGASTARDPQSLALGPDSLWVLTGAPAPVLFHVSTRDGSILRRVALPVPKDPDSWAAAIVADGSEALVVASADGKTRVTRVGETEKTLFERDGRVNDQSDVRVDADFVYFNLMNADLEEWKLYRLSKAGGEPTQLVPPDGGEGYEMLAHEGHIFFLGHVSSSVWRLSP